MNHAPTPSSPAPQSPSRGHGLGLENSPNSHAAALPDTQDAQNAPATTSRRARKRSLLDWSQRPGLNKKLQFLTQLLRNLDALVYAELSALYYMECSFFRFCIRSFAQFTFLTPKSDSFPLIMQAHRSHVISIFLPNILCILLHVLSALPEATEESRGYLHGGVIVDFIGQKAPASRLPLLLLDLAVLALQCLMLSVHSEREKLRSLLEPFRAQARQTAADATPEDSNGAATAQRSTTQDHDAEERGVLRSTPADVGDANGIEMQDLNPESLESREVGANGESRGLDANEERDPLLHETRERPRAKTRLMEDLNSGNAVLGDFHILHTIRTATTDYEGAAAHSFQTLGYTAAIAALTARARARQI